MIKHTIWGKIHSMNADHARVRCEKRVVSSSFPKMTTEGMVMVASNNISHIDVRYHAGMTTHGRGVRKVRGHALRNGGRDMYPSCPRRRKRKKLVEIQARSTLMSIWCHPMPLRKRMSHLQFCEIPTQCEEFQLPSQSFGQHDLATIAAAHTGCLREQQSPYYSSTFCIASAHMSSQTREQLTERDKDQICGPHNAAGGGLFGIGRKVDGAANDTSGTSHG